MNILEDYGTQLAISKIIGYILGIIIVILIKKYYKNIRQFFINRWSKK